MKLVQKRFLRGRREFEIEDDAVNIRLKSPFREQKLTVMLAVLNPEPVVNEPFLEFHSRVKGVPLLSLLLDNPDTGTFNAFVDRLKRRAGEEYGAFTGLRTGSAPAELAVNSYEQPPDFGEPASRRPDKPGKPVRIASLDSSIEMLKRHLDAGEIESLLTALESLKAEPENESRFAQLVTAFDDLGPRQGAVLTYAPYISILLSDDPFGY